MEWSAVGVELVFLFLLTISDDDKRNARFRWMATDEVHTHQIVRCSEGESKESRSQRAGARIRCVCHSMFVGHGVFSIRTHYIGTHLAIALPAFGACTKSLDDFALQRIPCIQRRRRKILLSLPCS
jgi:hypothetical protein